MQHRYSVFFKPTRSHPRPAIKALVARYPGLKLDRITDAVYTDSEQPIRRLYEEAKQAGFACQFTISTSYGREDALSGELGILWAGERFSVRFPADAFEFGTGCPRCGVGAFIVKPHVLSAEAARHKGNFLRGVEGTWRVLIRTPIAEEVIEATKQPWCMRHPTTHAGAIVKEWMEPVPCATMPPLSRKSTALWGLSMASVSVGEPLEVNEPCSVCGRTTWEPDRERHPRLVYPREAIRAAQRHAVLSMYEPLSCFPSLDPVRRRFNKKGLYGMPLLLFNKKAIEVLVRYTQTEHIETSSSIQPVFAED